MLKEIISILLVFQSFAIATSYISSYENIEYHYQDLHGLKVNVLPIDPDLESYSLNKHSLHKNSKSHRGHSIFSKFHKRSDEHEWHRYHYSMTFKAHGKQINAYLEPNIDFIHEDAKIIIDDGELKTVRLGRLCFFTGTAFYEDDYETEKGWASVIFYNSKGLYSSIPTLHFEGTFGIDGEIFIIDSRNVTANSMDIQVGRKKIKEVKDSNSTFMCGYDSDIHHKSRESFGLTNDVGRLFKRAPAFASGCPITKKMLYMGAAADCSYAAQRNGVDGSIQAILGIWLQVNALYQKTFNVAIGLIDIYVLAKCGAGVGAPWNQDCSAGYTISNRLSDFSKWRGSYKNSDAGLWHLLTACNTMPVVGLSWAGLLCVTQTTQNPDGSYVSGTGVSSIISSGEFEVVAHELGHSFGANHDCIDGCNCVGLTCSCCPCGQSAKSCSCSGNYIMNPTSDSKSIDFSPCTKGLICAQIAATGTCLKEPGSMQLFNGSICGNGVKEGNEECDCGTQCANDTCCTPSCKLKPNAKCDDLNDDCCRNCQIIPASANFVCRPSQGSCDLAEMCMGKAGCPPDQHAADGAACNITNAYCASGQCTNRDMQCQTLGKNINSQGSCTVGNFDLSMACQMSCAGPDGCYLFQNNFLDGTECLSGVCYNGTCMQTGMFSWFQSNPWIFGVIGGGVLFFILICCWISRCRKASYRYPPRHRRREPGESIRKQYVGASSQPAYNPAFT